jgi:hypothetical protein
VLAGAGAEVDDPVGGADGVLVVLDDDHRVALVADLEERREQPLVVALVEADAGLVEHVHDAAQPGADLGRQADSLALAAGQRSRRPIEAQVAKPHLLQEAQALADLLQQRPGHRLEALRDLHGGGRLERLVDGQLREVGD